MTYSVTILHSLAEFEACQQEWDQLLASIGINNFALSHFWLSTYLKHFPPAKLMIVLIRNQAGGLIAAAPWSIRNGQRGLAHRFIRKLQFIGTEPEVYDSSQILIHPAEPQDEVLHQLGNAIIGTKKHWDVIDFRHILDRQALEIIAQQLAETTFQSDLSTGMSIPMLKLPESREAYLKTCLKTSYRKDLKRIQNILQRDFPEQSVHLEVLPNTPSSLPALEAFFKQYCTYWKHRGVNAEPLRFPRLMAFYQDILLNNSREVPRLVFSTLKFGEERVSYHFDIDQGNHFSGYMLAYHTDFQKYRPGMLHIEAIIEHAMACGHPQFSFGRGEQGYKQQWNTENKPLWNLTVFRSPWAKGLWAMDERLKKMLGRFISRGKRS